MKSNFDDEIKSIVTKMHEIELDNIPNEEELEENYVLSDVFFRKMEKLIAKTTQKRKAVSIIKYVSTAAAVLILIWGLMNPSVVLDAYEEVIRGFEDHTSFQFKQDVGEVVVPEYEVGYVLEGYELEREVRLSYSGIIVYEKEGNLLSVSYGTADGSINIDNEVKSYQIIKSEKGTEIHYFEADIDQKESSMTWLSEDENIVFNLIGSLPKEELLKIQESVREKN